MSILKCSIDYLCCSDDCGDCNQRIVLCDHCGCSATADELIYGMCDTCYEEYNEDY